jgi:hypothetical protein
VFLKEEHLKGLLLVEGRSTVSDFADSWLVGELAKRFKSC